MKIHCIGIGGIGVSALARYYLSRGDQITGSDLGQTEIVDDLEKVGAQIKTGRHQASHVPDDVEMVVYSAAVQESNPELERARSLATERPLPILTYAQALGQITRNHCTVAISGTHGKSTVVSMLSLILVEAGLDPTVIIGTKLKAFGNSNFRLGQSRYFIIEADEWHGSFLNYHPEIIILTNIEEDHLDYYRDLNHILDTYQEYLGLLSSEGTLVFNQDDHNIMGLLERVKIKNQAPFSLNQTEADKVAQVIKVPGRHNISNALAALAAARTLGVDDDTAYRAIGQYYCCWRRFDQRAGELEGTKFDLIHDYAHHPTEVRAVFQALEERFKNRRIWFIFQPHQYQRVFYFFDRFVEAFQNSREGNNQYRIVITDIYDVPGRERASLKHRVSAQKIVEAVGRDDTAYWPFNQLSERLSQEIKTGDIVVAAGAGDIYQWAVKLSP